MLVSQLLASPRAGDLQYLMASVSLNQGLEMFWNSLVVLWLRPSASTSKAWIQSLVGELRSPKLCGMAKEPYQTKKPFPIKEQIVNFLLGSFATILSHKTAAIEKM